MLDATTNLVVKGADVRGTCLKGKYPGANDMVHNLYSDVLHRMRTFKSCINAICIA